MPGLTYPHFSPRSYVKLEEEKKDYSNNYGNQPLEVSQVCKHNDCMESRSRHEDHADFWLTDG